MGEIEGGTVIGETVPHVDGQPRIRLREEVLPVLEALWPDAASRVTATTDVVRVAAGALDRELDAAFGAADQCSWDRATLRARPAAFICLPTPCPRKAYETLWPLSRSACAIFRASGR